MANGKYHEWLEPDGLLRLEAWARDGLTDEQIVGNMGIGYSTLQAWKSKYQDIQDSLKRGKEVVDVQVENALLKRALGYEFIETTKEPVEGPDGDIVLVTTKTVTKHVQPDTTAQIFWLKNRKPEDWRDKRDVEMSGSLNKTDPFDGLTPDELRAIIRDG